jgi:1-acyl-sn-glycerol-3-phosphate acyltransferase
LGADLGRTAQRPASQHTSHCRARLLDGLAVQTLAHTEDQDPLEPLVQALTNGDSLVIFPEGTRSNKGLPQAFKSGLFHLAEQFPGVQLVPVWIDNVQRVMPKGEVVPVPILCTATFGAPLYLNAGEDKRVFLERARNAVIALRPISS